MRIESYGLQVSALSSGPQKTEFKVPARTVLAFEASGRVSPDGSAWVDADGDAKGTGNWRSYNYYKGAQHCSLIGRVGEYGKIFAIGKKGEIAAYRSDFLFLGVNDTHVSNNKGALSVDLLVWPMHDLCENP